MPFACDCEVCPLLLPWLDCEWAVDGSLDFVPPLLCLLVKVLELVREDRDRGVLEDESFAARSLRNSGDPGR